MLYENNQKTIPYILSDSAQKAYAKFKAILLKIFALIKRQEKEKDIKEQFYDAYIDFARKLDADGYENESNCYMNICAMYYDLMDREDELIAHEEFFMDLFKAFDELLFVRINKPDKYDAKYREFLLYNSKMQQYYYTEVAIPSEKYDKDVCREIISNLSGGL